MIIGDIEKMQIYKHAESEYPDECCGVLLGYQNDFKVCEIVPADNIDKDNNRKLHFVMNPLDYYKVEQDAEKRGLDVIGFYHSHADHPAVPSKEDKRYMIPGCVYAIVSVIRGKCADLKTYEG